MHITLTNSFSIGELGTAATHFKIKSVQIDFDFKNNANEVVGCMSVIGGFYTLVAGDFLFVDKIPPHLLQLIGDDMIMALASMAPAKPVGELLQRYLLDMFQQIHPRLAGTVESA